METVVGEMILHGETVMARSSWHSIEKSRKTGREFKPGNRENRKSDRLRTGIGAKVP